MRNLRWFALTLTLSRRERGPDVGDLRYPVLLMRRYVYTTHSCRFAGPAGPSSRSCRDAGTAPSRCPGRSGCRCTASRPSSVTPSNSGASSCAEILADPRRVLHLLDVVVAVVDGMVGRQAVRACSRGRALANSRRKAMSKASRPQQASASRIRRPSGTAATPRLLRRSRQSRDGRSCTAADTSPPRVVEPHVLPLELDLQRRIVPGELQQVVHGRRIGVPIALVNQLGEDEIVPRRGRRPRNRPSSCSGTGPSWKRAEDVGDHVGAELPGLVDHHPQCRAGCSWPSQPQVKSQGEKITPLRQPKSIASRHGSPCRSSRRPSCR